MRTLEELLFNALGPLVANRVHPVVVPEGATLPCIRYTSISAIPESSLCGSSGLVRSSVQVDVLAQDYSMVRTLREQVITAMQGFPLDNILSLEQEAFEPELMAYRRILQFNVAEQEGA